VFTIEITLGEVEEPGTYTGGETLDEARKELCRLVGVARNQGEYIYSASIHENGKHREDVPVHFKIQTNTWDHWCATNAAPVAKMILTGEQEEEHQAKSEKNEGATTMQASVTDCL
jgi:hypothetical protein